MNVIGHNIGYKDGNQLLKNPGDFWFSIIDSFNKVKHFSFLCPCGCGRVHGCIISLDGHNSTWKWDGNEEKPTLTPSLLSLSECKWHGYLTNGVFCSI